MRVTVVRGASLTPAQRRVVAGARLGPLLRESGATLGVAPRWGMTVRLADDAELRALNARFLGHDEPTDVLAFPSGDRGRVGDVAISVERAIAQADDGVAELRLLAVHGLLHCIGHDHATAAGAATMTEATRALLPGQAVPALVSA